jgi:hypothetical protein
MAGRNGKRASGAKADLGAIAESLLEATAMIETAINSLAASDGRGYPELFVFERALRDLNSVHGELDRYK